jgi:hypothetical protein
MDNKLKNNLWFLRIIILIAAVIPLLNLLVPSLPEIIRQMVLLIIISYPLCCLLVLIWGSLIIWDLPCKKFLRRIIFIVWLALYTLLCWGWATLVIFFMLQKMRL